jgi:hypothetical protein
MRGRHTWLLTTVFLLPRNAWAHGGELDFLLPAVCVVHLSFCILMAGLLTFPFAARGRRVRRYLWTLLVPLLGVPLVFGGLLACDWSRRDRTLILTYFVLAVLFAIFGVAADCRSQRFAVKAQSDAGAMKQSKSG